MSKLVLPEVLYKSSLYSADFSTSHGFNDRFAIGDAHVMRLYGMRFKYLDDFVLHAPVNILVHAETYLNWSMEQNHIRDRKLTCFRFGRIRANGYIEEFDIKMCSTIGKTITRVKERTRQRIVTLIGMGDY
jgi:hypothetical protein